MLLAETRSNEWKGQSGAAATASSESLPFWRTHYLALSDLSLFNQPMSAAWLPSIRSGSIGREVGWLARDISWSVGRFVSYKIIQLCQRAVVDKVRGVCVFLKWIKQWNNSLERLRALYSLVHPELQGCDMESSSHSSGAPWDTELLSLFPIVMLLAWL